MVKGLLLLAMAIFLASPVAASEITGPAAAVNSTVIQINGQRIMLFGINSVMRKQNCTIDGKIWQCWAAAVRDLQTLIDQGPATCEVIKEPDVFGRILARCAVNGQSLNEQLVRRGYALARPSETTDYVAAEAAAKDRRLGLWQGQFVRPSDFRKAAGIFVDRP